MIRREDFYHALEHDIKPVSKASFLFPAKGKGKILKCDWLFNITSHARVTEQCASFRSVKGQLYFDGDDDDDFFLLVRIPFVIRQIYFYGLLTYYILHTFVPLVAKNKTKTIGKCSALFCVR